MITVFTVLIFSWTDDEGDEDDEGDDDDDDEDGEGNSAALIYLHKIE